MNFCSVVSIVVIINGILSVVCVRISLIYVLVKFSGVKNRYMFMLMIIMGMIIGDISIVMSSFLLWKFVLFSLMVVSVLSIVVMIVVVGVMMKLFLVVMCYLLDVMRFWY